MFATDLVKELKTERQVYLVTPEDKLYYALEIIDCNREVPQSNINALKKSIEKIEDHLYK